MTTYIYCRVSSEDQEKKHSLTAQEKACREYAKKYALPLPYIVISEQGSGKKFEEREKLMGILSDIGEGDYFLVTEQDRLSRTGDITSVIKYQLRKSGVRFLTTQTDPTKEETTEDWLLGEISKTFAELELRLKETRARRGIAEAKRKGVRLTRPPIGYRMHDGHIFKDENTFPLVKSIFERKLEEPDITYYALAQEHAISPVQIKRILSSPFYAGKICVDGEYRDVHNMCETAVGFEDWKRINGLDANNI